MWISLHNVHCGGTAAVGKQAFETAGLKGGCPLTTCSTFSNPSDRRRALSTVRQRDRSAPSPVGSSRASGALPALRRDLARTATGAWSGSRSAASLRRPRRQIPTMQDGVATRSRSRATLKEGVAVPARSPVSPQAGNQNIRASRGSTRRTMMWMQPAPVDHSGSVRMRLRQPAWTNPLCRVASHALLN